MNMIKQNRTKIRTVLCLALLAALLFCQSCIRLEPNTDTPTTPPQEQSNVPQVPEHYYPDAVYVYSTDVDEDVLLTGLSPVYLLLANKDIVLGSDYIPENLSSVDNTYVAYWHHATGLELEARVLQALYQMLQEMHAAGVNDVLITSAYRSYGRQQELFNSYVAEEFSTISSNAYKYLGQDYIQKNYLDKGKRSLSYADALAVVRSYSAEPGASEHQTGLCVDFITSTMQDLDNTFENTDAFAWLAENAYKFGFVLRYPEGKEDVTGYIYEPWHYRFVGREAATDMHYLGLTLEEYLISSDE